MLTVQVRSSPIKDLKSIPKFLHLLRIELEETLKFLAHSSIDLLSLSEVLSSSIVGLNFLLKSGKVNSDDKLLILQ